MGVETQLSDALTFAAEASDGTLGVGGRAELSWVPHADTNNARDGRYVEMQLDYAYRPVKNDRPNGLFSYTNLHDVPSADQVNIDGDANGPRQCSHILDLALSYDLNQQFTLGAKYGSRDREEAPRGTDALIKSTAHLGILRPGYHIVHNWAILYPKADTSDFGTLLGVYRDFGDNFRLGAGYSWGDVSDNQRSLETDREGVFVNVFGKF